MWVWSNDIQPVCLQSRLRLLDHGVELGAVGSHIRDFVGDDQMNFGVHRSLHIVAHHAGTPATRGNGAGVGIGQRDLPVRRRKHSDLKLFQALHILLQGCDLVFQVDRLGRARQFAVEGAKITELRDEMLFRQEYPATAAEAFQASGEDVLIPTHLVMRARKTEVEPYGPLVVGVDPARFGDDRTSIIRRRSRVVFDLESYSGKDTMKVAGPEIRTAAKARARNFITFIGLASSCVRCQVVPVLRRGECHRIGL